jgi:Flp pilus assembly pilin Flp
MWTQLNALILSLSTRTQLAGEALILSLSTRVQVAKEEGQTAVEYAMVIGLISVILVGVLALLKTPLKEFVEKIEL